MMKNIAPEITRQRLLIEGYYQINMNEPTIRDFLYHVSQHLDLRTYKEPIIFSPETGTGREENMGYDAFIPLIDSGISLYVWSKARFLSIVIFTCKKFNDDTAIDFTKDYFKLKKEISFLSF